MQSIAKPDPSLQVRMHQALLGARKTWLRDALNDALAGLNPGEVKAEIAKLVPEDAQRILAAAGIRDEHVFPTRIVLEKSPPLLAYYRLVLGLSRKNFYHRSSGRGLFSTMENSGRITILQAQRLDELIGVMIDALADVVRQLSPAITTRDVEELPLLTLGSQLQGARNVEIGKQGTQDVFLSIRSIVEPHIHSATATEIVVTNAAGRTVYITLAADPDVRIREDVGGALSYKVAIEIKAGTDASNAHNRAGEAEKSHQKAEDAGARDFWTLIALKGLDAAKLRTESPRTRSWFDVAQVLGRNGPDWLEFRRRVIEVVGIVDPGDGPA